MHISTLILLGATTIQASVLVERAVENGPCTGAPAVHPAYASPLPNVLLTAESTSATLVPASPTTLSAVRKPPAAQAGTAVSRRLAVERA
ncbi:hypothetical protein GJ744_010121 [Endocarpon pusillum]|uniref:Uncharacterized protein n=1 Tax=Endocarpon pusillum TaxID=364733 RepID=A0A8H7E412_9EURO|nr:hypothetical protein GJ744_010121 [Endocarpon pusillum]